jgi:hypothetical protein
MNFDAAIIKEHCVEIGIFATTMDILSNEKEADNLIRYVRKRIFAGFQVVLMAQDGQGTPHYYGKQHLIRLLDNTTFSKIHFRRYTIP